VCGPPQNDWYQIPRNTHELETPLVSIETVASADDAAAPTSAVAVSRMAAIRRTLESL
jgi:hypothetical protein